MVQFTIHSSPVSLLLEPLSVPHEQSRVQIGKPCGKRNDHGRVAIWTECQRMDTLLAESCIFLCRRDTESITVSLAAPAQKLARNMICFVPLSPRVPGLAFAATKRCCNLEATTFQARRGSWQLACSLRNDDVRC